ncbi:uncharacterized protein [Palaemon carinicauda]|uniref:uncharacterized protein n=1 Tax=Palaemon carinicauda TaxID=392227 RepID=UPI0035B5C618
MDKLLLSTSHLGCVQRRSYGNFCCLGQFGLASIGQIPTSTTMDRRIKCCTVLAILAVFSTEVTASLESLPLDKSSDGMIRYIENSRFRVKRQLDFSPGTSHQLDIDLVQSASDAVHFAPNPAAFNIESSDCTGLCKSRSDGGSCELDAGCCATQFQGPEYLRCIIG